MSFRATAFPFYANGPSFFLLFHGQFSSVQFSHSVVSNSLRPHGPQLTKPPCPLPTPGVYSNSCPLSQWYHPTISSSVVPFSSRLQSFPASGSFPMSQLFASGGQNISWTGKAQKLSSVKVLWKSRALKILAVLRLLWGRFCRKDSRSQRSLWEVYFRD